MSFFRERDLALRSLLTFLGEPADEDNKTRAIEEAEQSESVAAVLRAHLPQVLRPTKLFEVLFRDALKFLDDAEHPDGLLGLLPRE